MILGLAAIAAGCSRPPDLAPGETGRIARVLDGDALALDTGIRVRLVEIEAPAPGYDGRADEPFAAESRSLLTSAALGRTAQLYYGGLSRDRYDRALAHVIAHDETGADLWLNGLMVRQGAARVRTFPDNARRVRKLYDLEEEARTAKRGLWALDHWRVRRADDLADAPYFAIVEGTLLSMEATPGDGSIRITPAGFVFATGDGLGPADPALNFETGKPIRVRGRIDARSGEPLVRVTHWGQLETSTS